MSEYEPPANYQIAPHLGTIALELSSVESSIASVLADELQLQKAHLADELAMNTKKANELMVAASERHHLTPAQLCIAMFRQGYVNKDPIKRINGNRLKPIGFADADFIQHYPFSGRKEASAGLGMSLDNFANIWKNIGTVLCTNTRVQALLTADYYNLWPEGYDPTLAFVVFAVFSTIATGFGTLQPEYE